MPRKQKRLEQVVTLLGGLIKKDYTFGRPSQQAKKARIYEIQHVVPTFVYDVVKGRLSLKDLARGIVALYT